MAETPAQAPLISFSARLARPSFTLDASFEAHDPLLALFGPSGSGKTTILNLIAGIERPDEGRIWAGGRLLVDTAKGVFVPAHLRRAGMVFQDAQLFPHMNVRQNLRFGRKFALKDEPLLPIEAVVETLGLEGLLPRWPASLSGGEKQRVALARALLAGPRILLMDEPLASLDEARKEEILPLIERVRDAFAIPIVYVTHSPAEVRRLAGSIVRLDEGRVSHTGPVGQNFKA